MPNMKQIQTVNGNGLKLSLTIYYCVDRRKGQDTPGCAFRSLKDQSRTLQKKIAIRLAHAPGLAYISKQVSARIVLLLLLLLKI